VFEGNSVRFAVLCLLVSAMLPSVSRAQDPVFTITPEESDVKFFVKASVATQLVKSWEQVVPRQNVVHLQNE
jgi:hypothetical protein